MKPLVIDSKGNSYSSRDLDKIAESRLTNFGRENAWFACGGGDRLVSTAFANSILDNQNPILFSQLKTEDRFVQGAVKFLDRTVTSNAGLCAFLSSGSTGIPKIIVHSVSSLKKSALKIVERYPEISGKRFHHFFPSNYMAGILNCTLIPLLSGGSIFLDDQFNFSSSFTTPVRAKEFKAKVAWLSPSMLASINIQASKGRGSFPEWEVVLAATGPLTTSVRDQVLEFSKSKIYNTFGTTESLFISTELEIRKQVDCGSPLSNVSARIMSEDGALCATGSGALYVKSDTVAKYIFQGFETVGGGFDFSEIPVSQDSYVPTGDAATIQNNRIQIEGRNDDIVVLGGLNISLARVESVAREFPQVIEVCAYARFGGTIADLSLYYEASDVDLFSERLFHEFLVEKLGMDDVPRKLFRRNLPRTPSGKVDRMQIRLFED